MTEQDPLQLLRDATQASDRDVDSLRSRLPIDLSTVADEAPEVPEAPAASPSRWPWLLAAAAALLAVGIWQLAPAPEPVEEAVVEVTTPQALDRVLTQGVVEFEPGIRLVVDGTGRIEGTAQNAVVHWESGRLDVEVDPTADVRLSVRTDSGEVDVLGTIFSVTQDPDGMVVALDRGKVEVRCEHGEGAILMPDQSHTCRPMTAGKALNEANSLRDDPAALLESTERGLTLATAGSAIEGELLVRRIEALQGLGRDAEALDEGLRYLKRDQQPRHDAVCARVRELGGACE